MNNASINRLKASDALVGTEKEIKKMMMIMRTISIVVYNINLQIATMAA
jgi:hypothetical protein